MHVRVWQKRQIVLTKGITEHACIFRYHASYLVKRNLKYLSVPDMMYFSQMNDDIVMDQIPLAEIHRVKEMEAGDQETELAKDANELMIETHPEGYNSGRTYYLQAQSTASCQDIIKKLVQYSAAAFERAHAQSAFRQAQLRVFKVYRSSVFQRFVAILIILVSIFKWASNPENTADVPIDRTLSSA